MIWPMASSQIRTSKNPNSGAKNFSPLETKTIHPLFLTV
jgi:hypothetical protein